MINLYSLLTGILLLPRHIRRSSAGHSSGIVPFALSYVCSIQSFQYIARLAAIL